MAKEIERKFLVADDRWRGQVVSDLEIRQFYIASTDRASVRVRIVDGTEALLTIKSAVSGMVRDEYEYPIPVADAGEMDALRTGEVIQKVRFRLACEAGDLTVDEFAGANAGLVIAEIELASEATSPALPDWLGREVTGDRRFYNADLSARPFGSWPPEERAATAA